MEDSRYIGFMDSGLGGISVLIKALDLMPEERFFYFGDSANAPYGTKDTAEVRERTEIIIKKFMAADFKAAVIACNTATSAAAKELRRKYPDFPIIGVEPAIKPAGLAFKGQKIAVLGTPVTLKEEKFEKLLARCSKYADYALVPCDGLMEFVERGELSGEKLREYLINKIPEEIRRDSSAVVLGCTHYPFVKSAIASVFHREVAIFDGGEGTARQLGRVLESRGLRAADSEEQQRLQNPEYRARLRKKNLSQVRFDNSKEDPKLLALSRRLLEERL